MIGRTLAHYQIVEKLGQGGMGEVYRAEDTHLHRHVAIKVLPSEFAHDPERVARFQREAEVLSSLNHPHIATLHGLEESDGTRFIVMELVGGETLASRLLRGPLPVGEALQVSSQIAEGLEAAHERGVIPRDLKPANVMIAADDTVKILDFGLAKALAGETGSADATESPTITEAMTRPGVILGTAAYMSPEQAKGRAADKRSDVWAFGCVLYEMLTGARAFDGEDVSETVAAVLLREPDWTKLPASVPSAVCMLLRHCLEKDRKRRIADLSAALFVLAEPAMTGAAALPGALRTASGRRERYAWTVAGLAVLVALAVGGLEYLRREPVETETVRFSIDLPEGWNVVRTVVPGYRGAPAPLAISPDGRRIAFLAEDGTGRCCLWLRALDTLVVRELPGTDGASCPFWSPDSRSLGFFADGKLKRIEVAGGPPVTVCKSLDTAGGTWSRDGIIVFSDYAGPLKKVSASGGEPAPATVLGKGEITHIRPAFLPDGRHFLYRGGAGEIYVASLDSAERTLLFENAQSTNAVFSEGYLLFLRERTLMAQPFDLGRLKLTGEPTPIAEGIQTVGTGQNGHFAASDDGVLIYQTGASGSDSQLTWFDRTGKAVATAGDRAGYRDVELSPDGTRAAVSMSTESQTRYDIWLVDLLRGGIRTRLTSDPANEIAPAWAPDGSRIVFSSNRDGNYDLFWIASSGVGLEEAILTADGNQYSYGWFHDGRQLIYQTPGETAASFDLWVLPLAGDRTPVPFLQNPTRKVRARFSPDGRWVAYESDESGRSEVYVVPFPKAEGKELVSTAGGTYARWRRDGKEIFYMAPDNRLMAAEVIGEGPVFRVGAVRPLFAINPPSGRYPYDVSADGQRFLVNTSSEVDAASTQPITVVLNWPAALRR